MTPLRQGLFDELAKLAGRGAFSRLTPESSNVRGYRYDAAGQALFVTFKNGGTYRYDAVPPAVAKALGRNRSTGKTINRLVKDKGFSYEKVSGDRRSLLHEIMESPVIDMVTDELMQRGLNSLGNSIVHPKAEHHHRRHGRSRNSTRDHWAKEASSITDFFDAAHRSLGKLAGVAKKQITFDGLRMKIEYEPGDIRTGKSKDGKTWERKMFASYGYVPGTKGMAADGDAIDVYVAAEPVEGKPVFEIRQAKKEGGYDESKFMIGWPDAAAAKASYLQHMPEWAFESITERTDNPRDFAASIHMAPMKKAAEPSRAPVGTGSPFIAGFADELTKEAGIRDVIQRLVSGRAAPVKRLGFFERRRLAKTLNVKPREVEAVLQHRQQIGRGARFLGTVGIGALAGSHLSRESADAE